MGAITRNLRRLGLSADAASTTAALMGGAGMAAAGSAVANAMMPTIESNDYTSETAAQYEAADPDQTEIAIGQETSTTSRKKKSQRGRTTPSIPDATAPATPVAATSTGLQI